MFYMKELQTKYGRALDAWLYNEGRVNYTIPDCTCVELDVSRTLVAGVFLCDGGGVDIPIANDGLKNVSDW